MVFVMSGLAALFMAGPAAAGKVDDLQARRAQILAELQAVDAELASQGANVVPAGSMTPTPGASDGLTGYGGLFVGAEQIRELSEPPARVVPNGGAIIGANMPLGGGWNAGIDGFAGAAGADGSRYFDVWGGGSVHLFWRDNDYALGIFGTGATLQGSGGDSQTTVAGGVDTAIFYPESTIVFQAGYLSRVSGIFNFETDNDGLSNGMAFRLQNRWFLGDNMRLDTGIVGAWGQQDGDQNEAGLGGLEIEYEHKFQDSPLAFFIGGTALAGMSDDDDGDEASLYYTARVGIRFLFGHETLKSEDRNGTTFKSLPVKEINSLAVDF